MLTALCIFITFISLELPRSEGAFRNSPLKTLKKEKVKAFPLSSTDGLRGPAAILFISRDACSDSIAKLYLVLVFFVGYRTIVCAMCVKMGYRTDVSV